MVVLRLDVCFALRNNYRVTKKFIITKFDCTKDPTNKKQYKCSKCSGSFLTQYNLNRHIASDHEGIKKLIDSVYEVKKKLYNTSVHESKKPLKCGICDNLFSKKGDLKKHIESEHTKKVSFKCDICYYRSSRKDYLK